MFLVTIFAQVILVPFSLLTGVNWNFFPQIFIFSLLATLSTFFYYYAVEKGDISLTATLVATYPVITGILSVIFLREVLTPVRFLAIILIIFAGFLISKPKYFRLKLESWVWWGLLGAVLIGFADFIGKVGITKFGLGSYTLAFSLSYIPSLGLNWIVDKNHVFPKIDKLSTLLPTLSGAFLLELGFLFFYPALSKGPLLLVSPVSSTYIVLTAVLAYIFLKEEAGWGKAFGITLAFLGVVLISL